MPITASSADRLLIVDVCAPTAEPTLPAAVTAMTAKPVMMLTRFTTRLEPTAAAADTPLR
jgi:hypothetical protein